MPHLKFQDHQIGIVPNIMIGYTRLRASSICTIYTSLFQAFNLHFIVSGIPVDVGKNNRHVIVANEIGAESLLQLINAWKDDMEETVASNESIEY